MKLLRDELFGPDAFVLPGDVLGYLQQQRRGFDFFDEKEEPLLHDRVLSPQKSVLDHLLHPPVLTRITDSRLYGNQYSVFNLLSDLTDAISAVGDSGYDTLRQNLQVEYVRRLVKLLDLSGDGQPDAIPQSAALFQLQSIRQRLDAASVEDDEAQAASRASQVFDRPSTANRFLTSFVDLKMVTIMHHTHIRSRQRSIALTVRSLALIVTVMLVTYCPTLAAELNAEINTEKVFGPEDPGGPYKHPASFDQLANGDLYLVFYGGSGEYQDDTAIFGARKRQGQKTWSTPKIIADTPNRSEGNAVIWQAPDGVVWLFYLTRYGDTWSTSRIKAKVSKDHAETWSDPFLIAIDQGMMVRSHPVVLANGNYLLPVYHEKGHDTESVGPDSTSLFLQYDQDTKEWSETNRIGFKTGCIQPAVAKVSDDYYVCYNRRGGDYALRLAVLLFVPSRETAD